MGKFFKNKTIFFSIILLTGILFLFLNDVGLIKWYKLKKERDQIQNEIDNLKFQENQLTNELDRLLNDAEYIKNIARKKFHMVRKGEKVFRVIDKRKIK